MSPTPDSTFCGHCGERLPPYGSAPGLCGRCAERFAGAPAAARSSAPSPRDPFLAAALALIFPGAGQIYNGHVLKAALVFLTSPLVVPWLLGVLDAYLSARRSSGTSAAFA